MPRISLALAALVFATVGSTFMSASATNCGTAARNAHDPFGSCETTEGQVKCGSGTDIAIGVIAADANKGVQACSNDERPLVISGRISVVRSGNNVAVGIDGGDKKNSGGASAWQRYDVRGDERRVCARRGTGGTWYTGQENGLGASNADSVNQGVGAGGLQPCQ